MYTLEPFWTRTISIQCHLMSLVSKGKLNFNMHKRNPTIYIGIVFLLIRKIWIANKCGHRSSCTVTFAQLYMRLHLGNQVWCPIAQMYRSMKNDENGQSGMFTSLLTFILFSWQICIRRAKSRQFTWITITAILSSDLRTEQLMREWRISFLNV